MTESESAAEERPATSKHPRAAWHFYRAAATLKEDYARAVAF